MESDLTSISPESFSGMKRVHDTARQRKIKAKTVRFIKETPLLHLPFQCIQKKSSSKISSCKEEDRSYLEYSWPLLSIMQKIGKALIVSFSSASGPSSGYAMTSAVFMQDE